MFAVAAKKTLRYFEYAPNAANFRSDSMSVSEYTLIFGLGPKSDGTPNTDVELAIALAAIEDASLKNCGGFTFHRGKGGWIDPAGKAIKEEVAILMVSGSYASIEAIAAIGKRMLGHTAIYVKKPDGSTILL
jgi:hypothetical protein